MDLKLFPTRLKQAREAAGLKQNQLAEMIGVTAQTISAYESTKENKGKTPALDKATHLAALLGVSLDWLCGSQKSMSNSDEDINLEQFFKKFVNLDHFFPLELKALAGGFHELDMGDIFDINCLNWAFLPNDPNRQKKALLCRDNVFSDFFQNWGNLKEIYKSGTMADSLYETCMEGLIKSCASRLEEQQKIFFDARNENNSYKNENSIVW